jgi:transposase-like protein
MLMEWKVEGNYDRKEGGSDLQPRSGRDIQGLLSYKGYPVDDAIESLNFSLRKIIKGRSAFPNDDSVYRLIYLGLEQISRKWTMPIRNWKAALQQFAILYEDRLPVELLVVTKA